MGLFSSEKTKQEKAKAQAAAERQKAASNRALEAKNKAVIAQAKADVKYQEELTRREKLQHEKELQEKQMIMNMSPEEREIYFQQIEEQRQRELKLQEELKRQEEEEKNRILEEQKQRNLDVKNKLSAISKAKMFDFSMTMPGSMFISGKSIKGTFGFVDFTVPFIYLKISEKQLEERTFDEKIIKKEFEIEIELALTGKYEINKKFMQGNILSFFVAPFSENSKNIEVGLPNNNYKSLIPYLDSRSRLNLRVNNKDYEIAKDIVEIINTRLNTN